MAAVAPFEASEDGGAAEHMMMVALETLYKDAGETDVQLGILRVVLQILQRHGGCPMRRHVLLCFLAFESLMHHSK